MREQEIHIEKIKAEEREREQTAQRAELQAQREHEIRKLEMMQQDPNLAATLAAQRPIESNRTAHRNDATRVDIAAKLLPNLDTESITSFFIMFERIALIQEWDRAIWTQILNVKLNSKCVKILSEMPVDQVTDYDVVKKTLLDAYQVTGYTYLREFRGIRKKSGESFIEFAFRLESLQKSYLNATDNAESIRQVFLQEQFVSSLPNELAVYLADHKAETLSQLAKILDNY